MDVKQIQEIAGIMQDNGLTLLELTQGDVSLRMERQPAQNIIIPAQGLGPAVAEAQSPAAPAAAPAPAPVGDDSLFEVKSPMVGVFYSAPSPEAEPFATVGSRVKKGDTLCVVEAMKMLNEIGAECDGEVAELCASDGQTVEYGQVLMKLKRG